MKFKIICISLLIIVSSFPSICFSEKPDSKVWEYYGKQSDGGVFYYNKMNIIKSSNIVSVWTYVVVGDDYRNKRFDIMKKCDLQKSEKFKNFDHEKAWVEIDCNKRLYNTKVLIDYDDKGNNFHSVISDKVKWVNIKTRTPIGLLYEKVCVTPK